MCHRASPDSGQLAVKFDSNFHVVIFHKIPGMYTSLAKKHLRYELGIA